MLSRTPVSLLSAEDSVAEQLAETNPHLGGDRLFLVDDVVERIPGYRKRVGNGRLAHGERGQISSRRISPGCAGSMEGCLSIISDSP